MYIIINETKYNDISRVKNSNGNLVFIGASLTGVENIEGGIACYRNDGFYLREDKPTDYLRTVIGEGSILLTNTPLPPEPQDTDEVSGEEVLAALEDVL